MNHKIFCRNCYQLFNHDDVFFQLEYDQEMIPDKDIQNSFHYSYFLENEVGKSVVSPMEVLINHTIPEYMTSSLSELIYENKLLVGLKLTDMYSTYNRVCPYCSNSLNDTDGRLPFNIHILWSYNIQDIDVIKISNDIIEDKSIDYLVKVNCHSLSECSSADLSKIALLMGYAKLMITVIKTEMLVNKKTPLIDELKRTVFLRNRGQSDLATIIIFENNDVNYLQLNKRDRVLAQKKLLKTLDDEQIKIRNLLNTTFRSMKMIEMANINEIDYFEIVKSNIFVV